MSGTNFLCELLNGGHEQVGKKCGFRLLVLSSRDLDQCFSSIFLILIFWQAGESKVWAATDFESFSNDDGTIQEDPTNSPGNKILRFVKLKLMSFTNLIRSAQIIFDTYWKNNFNFFSPVERSWKSACSSHGRKRGRRDAGDAFGSNDDDHQRL